MIILPAIDLYKGQVVRLVQGDYSRMTIYSLEPVQKALEFKKCGATHLHIVDLYGAREGKCTATENVKEICRSTGLSCEIGGGIRTAEDIEKYLECGADRVIIGTKAITAPEFLKEIIKEYGSRISVGVDARNGKVAINGWLETTETDSYEFTVQLKKLGVKNVIYTDISKDGALGGANTDCYSRLCETGINITASGGVSSYPDIEKLKKAGCYGAIIGKAIYTGYIEIGKAIETANAD